MPVPPTQSLNIVVIGAGITGLTTTHRLLQAQHSVHLIAASFPPSDSDLDAHPVKYIDHASCWAGAHNRWIPPAPMSTEAESALAREHTLARVTYDRMSRLATEHAAEKTGLHFVRGVEYLEELPRPQTGDNAVGGDEQPVYQTLTPERAAALGYEDFRLLGEGEMPTGVQWGCEYRTWCVDPLVYCRFLLGELRAMGGRVREGRVEVDGGKKRVSGDEVFARVVDLLGKDVDVDVIVNATGRGFGDDENVFITRGQTVLVASSTDRTITRQNADGTWTFSIPRPCGGGTVIGGTKEVNNWATNPSTEMRTTLLDKFAAMDPSILGPEGKFSVRRDNVGRRPSRKGGPRIEGEIVAVGEDGGDHRSSGEKKRLLVHAYGLGGRGYELSWGVAEKVVEEIASHHLASSKE